MEAAWQAGINGQSLKDKENQLKMVESFINNKEDFLDNILKDRNAIKSNKIFYNKKNREGTNAELAVNQMMYRHYLIDYKIRNEILASDYKEVVISLFGDDI